jgi:hypothetical protein
MEQFKVAARMRPYYEEAAANYRRARDLNFQRVRKARARLRSFDHETAMEAAPGAFGLVAIENVGLGPLDGSELLAPQSPRIQAVEAIETLGQEIEVRTLGDPSVTAHTLPSGRV